METRGRPKTPLSEKIKNKTLALHPRIIKKLERDAKKAGKNFSRYISDLIERVK